MGWEGLTDKSAGRSRLNTRLAFHCTVYSELSILNRLPTFSDMLKIGGFNTRSRL